MLAFDRKRHGKPRGLQHFLQRLRFFEIETRYRNAAAGDRVVDRRRRADSVVVYNGEPLADVSRCKLAENHGAFTVEHEIDFGTVR